MLHLLETFCTVVETGSLNKAAEFLHLTQPAITRQVKSLEAQLGAVLLTRTPHGVELTPAGAAVLPHARQAIAAAAACRHAAQTASGNSTSRLRIAAGLMNTLYTLPPVIAAFQEQHPDVAVDLLPGNHREVIDHLLAYEVDVAILASEVTASGARTIRLFSDPLLLVTHPDSPALGRLADLQGLSLLVLQPQAGFRQEIERALAEHGVTCRLVEHPTVETIKTAIALQMGAAILPASAIRDEVRQGKLSAQPIADWPESSRKIQAFVRSEGELSQPVRSFVNLLRKHYGDR